MTLLLWIGVVIVIIAAIIKNMKKNVIVFHFGGTPDSHDNPRSDHQSRKRSSPFGFGNFPNGFSGQEFSSQQPTRNPDGSPDNGAEQMVCCEYCDVFVPASQSIRRAGHTFCSHEHAAAWFSNGHKS